MKITQSIRAGVRDLAYSSRSLAKTDEVTLLNRDTKFQTF